MCMCPHTTVCHGEKDPVQMLAQVICLHNGPTMMLKQQALREQPARGTQQVGKT